MKNQHYRSALLAAAIVFLASCSSPKKFVYLQDMEPGHGYPADLRHEAVVHADDRLDITVSSKNPELAIPFNANGGAFQVTASGTVSESSASKRGYRVDVDGNIDFPILGKLHVEGLTVSEVTSMIRNRIIEGKYIKDPLVSLEFLNFRYSVLGAVGSTGTFTVEGDRITLLEAIAKAGDISPRGRVNHVTVIREEDGERVAYVHDLRSKDLFNSPCYYLQQNDIVYVEPKYRKQDREDRSWKYITGILSALTAVCSIVWAIRR